MSEELNGRVAVVSIVAVLITVFVICLTLGTLLFSMSSRYIDERERNAALDEQIYSLQQVNTRLLGKLDIYETFLLGNKRKTFDGMVRLFLRRTGSDSTKVTIRELEDWMSHNYIGGEDE